MTGLTSNGINYPVAYRTSDLKLEILGVTPISSALAPQEIVALSALISFEAKTYRAFFEDIKKKEKDLQETVQKILLNSALRGHASMATTPVLTISYRASKFLDSMLTGIVFSSSIMASGRRTPVSPRDIIFPSSINRTKKAKALYRQVARGNIEFFQSLLDQGVPKDEASKILQYGLIGTGIISLSVESLISFKREYENEKEWLPEEAGLLLKQIERQLKKLGLDWLWATREVAPRNIYPYPNIFKDPGESNLVRELRKKHHPLLTPEVIQVGNLGNLKKRLKKAMAVKDWLARLQALRSMARDYNLAVSFEVLSSVPWRVWGEKKRHRTVPMIVDSIYHAVEKGIFSLPPTVAKNKKMAEGWRQRIEASINCYWQMVEWGIPPRDAIFVIPRGIRIDVLQHFDLYNLLLGYYPLRLCTTAEEEMLRLTEEEVKEIKKILRRKKLGWLSKYLVPKCHLCGFCPEKKFCAKILKAVRPYTLKIHRQKQKELEKRFRQRLIKIAS